MKLTNILKIGLLSIPTLLTGCKSSDTPGVTMALNFNDPSVTINLVVRRIAGSIDYINLIKRNGFAENPQRVHLEYGDFVYTEASNGEQTYSFPRVHVRDGRDPYNYRGDINVGGRYLIRFDYDSQTTYVIL